MSILKINGRVVKTGSKRDVEAALKRHYQALSPNEITPFSKVLGTLFMRDSKNSRIERDDWGNELLVQHGLPK